MADSYPKKHLFYRIAWGLFISLSIGFELLRVLFGLFILCFHLLACKIRTTRLNLFFQTPKTNIKNMSYNIRHTVEAERPLSDLESALKYWRKEGEKVRRKLDRMGERAYLETTLNQKRILESELNIKN